MNEPCDNLDAYLIGDLTAADKAAFALHLCDCEGCREVIDQQHWIDSLLQESSQLESEAAPPRIASNLRITAARKDSSRKHILVVAFSTAAAALIALSWVISRPADDSVQTAKSVIASTNDALVVHKPVHATFVPTSNAIAMPVASHHPDVTIVRIYPAFRPRYESTTATIEPEATTKNSWQFTINGS